MCLYSYILLIFVLLMVITYILSKYISINTLNNEEEKYFWEANNKNLLKKIKYRLYYKRMYLFLEENFKKYCIENNLNFHIYQEILLKEFNSMSNRDYNLFNSQLILLNNFLLNKIN